MSLLMIRVSVGCFLGAFLQLELASGSILQGGVAVEEQHVGIKPNLVEESLIRRMSVDHSGQIHQAEHDDSQATSLRQVIFTCAEIRAKYGSESSKSDQTLCKDIADAQGTASCCQDTPKTCCRDPNACTLDDAFSALDMDIQCKGSSGATAIQAHEAYGHDDISEKSEKEEEQEDDVIGSGEAGDDVAAFEEIFAEFEEEKNIFAEFEAKLLEKKDHIHQRLQALRKRDRKQLHARGANRTGGSLLEQDATSGRKGEPTQPIPLWNTKLGNLEAHDFQQRVAAGAATGLAQILVGGSPNWNDLANLGFEIAALIHPAVSFFAGFLSAFFGMFFGSSDDAFYKKIMEQVDKKINANNYRLLKNSLNDLMDQLSFMPALVVKASPDVAVGWWLIIQHDLAVKKTNMFHEKCIATVCPDGVCSTASIAKPSVLEMTSNAEVSAGIETPGADSASRSSREPGKSFEPALVEENFNSTGNHRIVRTKGAGNSLDRSLEAKGGTPAPPPDDCDKWNYDGEMLEIQWTFSELHLQVLSTIAQIKKVFIPEMRKRIVDVGHEYSVLMDQAYEKFKTYRLSQIHKKQYTHCTATGYRCQVFEGVQDDYINKKFDDFYSQTRKDPYYNNIKTQLETLKTVRVDRLKAMMNIAAGSR